MAPDWVKDTQASVVNGTWGLGNVVITSVCSSSEWVYEPYPN